MTPPFKCPQEQSVLLGRKAYLAKDAAEGWDSPVMATQGSLSKPGSHPFGELAFDWQDVCQFSGEALHAHLPLLLPRLAQKVTPRPLVGQG